MLFVVVVRCAWCVVRGAWCGVRCAVCGVRCALCVGVCWLLCVVDLLYVVCWRLSFFFVFVCCLSLFVCYCLVSFGVLALVVVR